MDRYEAKLLKLSRAVPLPSVNAALPPLKPFKAYSCGRGYRFYTDGTLQQRVATPTNSRARILDLGHGQIEAVVQPASQWFELPSLTPYALAVAVELQQLSRVFTVEEQAERDALNEERSCRRARTKVRRLAKFKRLDTMLTLTYSDNQTDRALAQVHLAAFIRRVKRIIPGFEYIAVAEPQKRGAWHWHMAVKQLSSGYWVGGRYVQSWGLLRAIWRSVIAGGGNIDVKAPGKPGYGVHKLSSYLTKYISKGFGAGVKHQNRYQCSGRDLPASVVLDFPGVGREGLVEVIRLILPELSKGRLHISPPLSSGGYFLSITPSG